MADTTYIVLRATEEPAGWLYLGKVENVGNSESAIKHAVNTISTNDRDGTYVAVPARSWKPVQVEAVQTTVLKLS